MSYEEFNALALSLPEVSEKVGKIENDWSRAGRHMCRLRDRRQAIAFRLPWAICDELTESQSSLFYVTPHYLGWPYVLIKLVDLDAKLATSLLKAAWTSAPETIPRRPDNVPQARA